jgi:predicted RNA-binding protein associated with RNAse of E/G family
MDHLLDIVISPDRSEWRWKDEDEFQEAVAIGVYSTEKARAIRAEGEGVIGRLETGKSPFWDSWEKWSPPAGWGIPALPAGWDKITAEDE